MGRTQVHGSVLGRAGGGLDEGKAAWAANEDVARIGKAGEERTGAILDALTARPGGPSVLHDLDPGPYGGNIDHVIVCGRKVLMVDAKVWRPGFYWQAGGHTRRGLAKFEYAARGVKHLTAQRSRLHNTLSRAGVRAHVAPPLIVVWPSNTRSPMRLWAWRPSGVRVVTGDRLGSAVRRWANRPADPAVVAALAAMLPQAGQSRAA